MSAGSYSWFHQELINFLTPAGGGMVGVNVDRRDRGAGHSVLSEECRVVFFCQDVRLR